MFSERDDIDLEREKFIAELKERRAANRQAAGCGRDQQRPDLRQRNQGAGHHLCWLSASGGRASPNSTRSEPRIRRSKLRLPAPLAYNLVRLPAGPPPPVPEAIAYLPNLPVINSAARGTGYFDTPTDPDAVFRSEMMVIRFGKRYCEPLILAVTSAYANNALTSLTLADFGVASARSDRSIFRSMSRAICW